MLRPAGRVSLGLAAILIIAASGSNHTRAKERPERRIRSVLLSAPAVGPAGTVYFSCSAASGLKRSYLYAVSPDGTLMWRSKLGLGSAGTPFLGRRGVIYVALSGGYDGILPRYLNPVLYAIDPHGAQKWKFPVFRGLEPGPTGAPTVDLLDVLPNDTIYLYGGPADSQYIYAVNGDGTLRWRFAFAGAGVRGVGLDGTIYLLSDSRLRALGPSGTLKWDYRVPDDVYNFHGNNLVIGRNGTIYAWGERSIVALSPTGRLKWKIAVGGSELAIGPDETAYALGSNLYAVDPDGTAKWESGIHLHFGGLALGHEGPMYVTGTTSEAWGRGSAELLAVGRDGGQRWKLPLGNGILPHIKAVGPDGIVYLLLEGVGGYGFLVAVGPDGTEKWHSSRLDNAYAQGGFSLAFESDVTIYVSGGALYAVKPSGAQQWKLDFGVSRFNVDPHLE